MQRKRGELGSIGEALADLPGPVQALIPSPPTQRHFTRADQVKPACRGQRIGPQSRFHGAMRRRISSKCAIFSLRRWRFQLPPRTPPPPPLSWR